MDAAAPGYAYNGQMFPHNRAPLLSGESPHAQSQVKFRMKSSFESEQFINGGCCMHLKLAFFFARDCFFSSLAHSFTTDSSFDFSCFRVNYWGRWLGASMMASSIARPFAPIIGHMQLDQWM
jgi:hypothetical protein